MVVTARRTYHVSYLCIRSWRPGCEKIKRWFGDGSRDAFGLCDHSPDLGLQFFDSITKSSEEIMDTPKAFANSSPGFERSDNPGGQCSDIDGNPERVRLEANAFSVYYVSYLLTQGCACAPTLG